MKTVKLTSNSVNGCIVDIAMLVATLKRRKLQMLKESVKEEEEAK